VAETTVKRLRRTGKAMGQVYQCWWRICREIIIFSRFEYHMFYVLYPFVAYLLTLLVCGAQSPPPHFFHRPELDIHRFLVSAKAKESDGP
jgi:hypothetical protein